MHRFFCPHFSASMNELRISNKTEIHHLKDVLRLSKGHEIEIFNGEGDSATAKIISIQQKEVYVEIISCQKTKLELPIITLACAIPKKGKFEVIIEKSTELGIDRIIPVKTQRTEVDLKGPRLDKKILRYQTVAINAAKQCSRASIPLIEPLTDFKSAMKQCSEDSVTFIPSLIAERKNILTTFKEHKKPKNISFFIGPEGDFTEKEYSHAFESGAIPVSLGKNILKVETAAICTVSCAIQYYRN